MKPGSSSHHHSAAQNEAEETIQAIHQGNVDAIVVQGPAGPQVVMLQGGDEPYRVLVERMSDGALSFDGDGTIIYANRRIADLTGIASERLIGQAFASLFLDPVPDNPTNAPYEARLRYGSDTRPVSVWSSPITVGGTTATLATITDLSIHRHAEAAATAERFARSILEQATDAIVVLGPDGRIIQASWMAEQLADRPPIGLTFSEAFPLEAQSSSEVCTLARFSQESLDTMLVAKPFHGVDVKLRNPALGKRSFLLSAGPLLNDVKQSVGSIVTLTEITERKRAEEQQTMLVAELNHRVKNILAIVQSVAGQTVRASSSLAAFDATFSGRIKAVSIAHDILTRTRWIGIGLEALLTAVLAPYRDADHARLTLTGPPVLLPARAVLPLSMAVHELATNALKYGALSETGGIVSIAWDVLHDGVSQVEMTWSEHGGPAVAAAEAAGFGTKLIHRVIAYDLDGTVDIAFPAGGVRAVLAFPLKTDPPSPAVPASATLPD